LLLSDLEELLEVSLFIEALPPDALVLLSVALGLLVLEPVPAVVPAAPADVPEELPRLDEPLPMLELLPLEP
jgi:hypothetical protein